MLSATWGNNFAVFQGTGGDVTVEGSHTVNGMQFVSNGYRLLAGTGGELNLSMTLVGIPICACRPRRDRHPRRWSDRQRQAQQA
jgi:hypothetical protein